MEVQAQIKVRGKSQRGIPRAKDRGKYPLATRIIDLTDGCGSIMYAKTNGKKRLYTCGRYMASAGAECEHNSVDAEAILNFVLNSLQMLVQKIGTRDNLLQRLETQDGKETLSETHLLKQDLQRLELERLDLAKRVTNAERRMASETNDDRYEAIGKQFDLFKSELRALDSELAVRRNQFAAVGQDENVDVALQIFDRVSKVLADPIPRSEITEMVQQIGLRIGLTFVGVRYGKNRILRQLESGMITFGDRELPVPLHGKYRLEKRGEASVCGPKDVIQSESNQLAREEVCNDPSSEMLGSARSEHNQSRHRNISSTKAMSGSPRLTKTPVFPKEYWGFFVPKGIRGVSPCMQWTQRPLVSIVELRKRWVEGSSNQNARGSLARRRTEKTLIATASFLRRR